MSENIEFLLQKAQRQCIESMQQSEQFGFIYAADVIFQDCMKSLERQVDVSPEFLYFCVYDAFKSASLLLINGQLYSIYPLCKQMLEFSAIAYEFRMHPELIESWKAEKEKIETFEDSVSGDFAWHEMIKKSSVSRPLKNFSKVLHQRCEAKSSRPGDSHCFYHLEIGPPGGYQGFLGYQNLENLSAGGPALNTARKTLQQICILSLRFFGEIWPEKDQSIGVLERIQRSPLNN